MDCTSEDAINFECKFLSIDNKNLKHKSRSTAKTNMSPISVDEGFWGASQDPSLI